MPAIASGIVIAWPSTAASIPSGWSRKTTMDGRYVRGADAAGDGGSTGGNSTHTHLESGTHTHSAGGSHYHTIIGPGGSGNGAGSTSGSPDVASYGTHGHSGFASGTRTAAITSTALTLVALNNDMSYKEVIWIESDGNPQGIPNGAIVFLGKDEIPGGWSRVQGDSYLKGAAASGDGGATGGSNTHTHTATNHLGDKHSHGSVTSSTSTEPLHADDYGTGFGTFAQLSHTHTVGISTGQDNASVALTMTAESSEPVNSKLNIIQNNTGATDFPDDVIALWLSTAASIPTDWTRYTGQDTYFAKGCNADGQIGTTGGTASGHNHGSVTCAATSVGHDHSDSTTTTGPSATQTGNAPGSTWAAGNHGHNGLWNVLLSYPTYANATGISLSTSASEAHYPLWIKAIFIKWVNPLSRIPQMTSMGVGV